MVKLEEQLKSIILKNVDFQIDGKSIKRGKVKVYNSKQFFIRFKLETETKTIEYDLPYPFKVVETKTGYLFDYCLSAFCPRTEELYWKMKMMNRDGSSKLHDSHLHVLASSL